MGDVLCVHESSIANPSTKFTVSLSNCSGQANEEMRKCWDRINKTVGTDKKGEVDK